MALATSLGFPECMQQKSREVPLAKRPRIPTTDALATIITKALFILGLSILPAFAPSPGSSPASRSVPSTTTPGELPRLLGMASFSQGCGFRTRFTHVNFQLWVGGVPLFDRILDKGDVGRTFIIDSDDSLRAAAILLTNGAHDRFTRKAAAVGTWGSCSVASYENMFFDFEPYPWLHGVDFQGAALDRLELHIDTYSVQPGAFTMFDLEGSVRVYGKRAASDQRATR